MGSRGQFLRVMLVKLAPRRAAAIAAVALVCTTVACAEPPPQTTQPTPSVITITLTNSGCTPEGLAAVIEAEFAAVLINTTSSRAQFNLHRLLDSHDYRELELHIQTRQQGIAAGRDTPVLPPMTVHAAGKFVEGGQRGKLEGTIGSGTYGFVCRRDSPTGATEAIYVFGPFRVG